MNFCPKCRKKLIVQDFCVECGADLSEYLKAEMSASASDSFDDFDMSSLENEAKKQLGEKEQQEKIKAEFDIENGELIKYKGKGGSVVIPVGVTKICEKAFYENDNVTNITVSEGVTEIDTFAFKATKALKTAKLPSSLRKIGYGIFMDSNVETVTFSDGLKELSQATFYCAYNLKRVDLPRDLEVICENAFAATDKLLAIFIPKSVRAIETHAFCSEGIVDLYFEAPSLPYGIEKGDSDEYENWKNQCYAIEHYGCDRNKVVIPNYDEEAKMYASSMENYNKNDFEVFNKHAVYCIREMENVSFPYGTANVYGQSLKGCKSPRRITLPRTTTVIDSGFMTWNMSNRENKTLESVYAPSVTKVGSSAFEGCLALTTYTNTEIIENIEGRAFANCNALVNFVFPPKIKRLGCGAFRGVPAFRNLVIPSTVEEIEDSAFDSCPNLESVVISDGVSKIGSHAFCQCKKLKTVKIPSSVKIIDKFAFSSCEGLEAIEIPEGVTKIGDSAFGYCKKLKSVKLPYSLQEITAEGDWDWSSFQQCESLQFVYIPRGRAEAYKKAFPSDYIAPNMRFIEY